MCCAVQPYASGNVCPLIGQYFPQCLLSCNRAPKIVQSRMGKHKFGEHGKHGKHGKHHPDDLKHPISWHLWQRLKNHNIRAWRSWPKVFILIWKYFPFFQYLWNRFPKLLASIFHYVSIFHVFCLIHFNILLHGSQTFSPLFSIMSVIL